VSAGSRNATSQSCRISLRAEKRISRIKRTGGLQRESCIATNAPILRIIYARFALATASTVLIPNGLRVSRLRDRATANDDAGVRAVSLSSRNAREVSRRTVGRHERATGGTIRPGKTAKPHRKRKHAPAVRHVEIPWRAGAAQTGVVIRSLAR